MHLFDCERTTNKAGKFKEIYSEELPATEHETGDNGSSYFRQAILFAYSIRHARTIEFKLPPKLVLNIHLKQCIRH